MADLTFGCPHCNQNIACDELWSGHEIQCPICKATLTVPAAQAPHPPAAAAGGTRLAKNAQVAAQTGNRNIPVRNLTGPPPKKQNPLVGILCGTGVIAALAVGGYYGYNWYKARQERQAQAEAASAAQAAAAAQPPPAPEPPKIHPPAWTLDVASAKVPEGAVNGNISGSNFVAEAVRIDPVGPARVLRFLQGEPTSPDREVLVYLYLKAGEKLGGQSLTVSNLARAGAGVPQVAKRWKMSDQPTPAIKPFTSGYAMKLELGKLAEDNTLPGKIFLALPDQEKTVVAGVFKASVTPVDPNAQVAQPQYQQAPTPGTTPGGPDRSAMERRYGIRR
jgi:hypothetical protein